MFWRLFQLTVFAGCMYVFIDMPGEKNMTAAALVSYLTAYMLTVLLTGTRDLLRKTFAKFRVRQHEKAESAGFVRREPFL